MKKISFKLRERELVIGSSVPVGGSVCLETINIWQVMLRDRDRMSRMIGLEMFAVNIARQKTFITFLSKFGKTNNQTKTWRWWWSDPHNTQSQSQPPPARLELIWFWSYFVPQSVLTSSTQTLPSSEISWCNLYIVQPPVQSLSHIFWLTNHSCPLVMPREHCRVAASRVVSPGIIFTEQNQPTNYWDWGQQINHCWELRHSRQEFDSREVRGCVWRPQHIKISCKRISQELFL